MRIVAKILRNRQDSHMNVHDDLSTCEINTSMKTVEKEQDCTSEPFMKPSLSRLINKMPAVTFGSKKQSITVKHIIQSLATELDRITMKTLGQSQSHHIVNDLNLEECKAFICKWSEELKCLRSQHKNTKASVERLRRSLEGLNIRADQVQKLTEAQKNVLWFIQILKTLPKSSICQEGYQRAELVNLYRRWKKGQLISMLPIMEFITRTLLGYQINV